MIHNAVAEHNLIPHTADDRGVTPGYQRNWTRAHDLNTAALLSFSARERCRLITGMHARRYLRSGPGGRRMLARPERLELPTYWFEASRSIRLSFGRASVDGAEMRRS